MVKRTEGPTPFSRLWNFLHSKQLPLGPVYLHSGPCNLPIEANLFYTSKNRRFCTSGCTGTELPLNWFEKSRSNRIALAVSSRPLFGVRIKPQRTCSFFAHIVANSNNGVLIPRTTLAPLLFCECSEGVSREEENFAIPS